MVRAAGAPAHGHGLPVEGARPPRRGHTINIIAVITTANRVSVITTINRRAIIATSTINRIAITNIMLYDIV